MKKKKVSLSTVALVVIFFLGLALLLYPSVSDWWNSFHQSKAIVNYTEAVSRLSAEQYDQLWEEARNYNASLLKRPNGYLLSPEQREKYGNLLNLANDGIMGYIEIPSISCALPIYHGTEESVLQVGIGHLDWTSLPAGGTSSHCVLSGHRGLPSATLFTHLDKLAPGDVFMLRVLDEILTYEIDQILIVEPHETSALLISQNADYCTLLTCTPYGINSHRLLVRGTRIENIKESSSIRVVANATRVEPLIVAPVVASPFLLLTMVWLLLPRRNVPRKSGEVLE